jgi:hypothetical protein
VRVKGWWPGGVSICLLMCREGWPTTACDAAARLTRQWHDLVEQRREATTRVGWLGRKAPRARLETAGFG